MEKSRILIVDDDVHLSKLVRLILERTDRHEVRVENRSRHALAAARDFRPQLVLLDVDMPGFDGGDVAAQFRADPSLRDTPIIFFTSLARQTAAATEVVKMGGENMLAKPVEPDVLIRCVAAMLLGKPALAA